MLSFTQISEIITVISGFIGLIVSVATFFLKLKAHRNDEHQQLIDDLEKDRDYWKNRALADEKQMKGEDDHEEC